MGDCGSYSAGLSVEFSLRKQDKGEKAKNTEEECKAFLDSNEIVVTSDGKADEETIKKAFEDGKRFVVYHDGDERMDSKEEDLEDIINFLDDYYDTENYSLQFLRDAEVNDIIDLDLELMKKYEVTEVNAGKTHSETILDIWESIYCENDNASRDSCKASKYSELLGMPDAKLVLFGDGRGNC